MRTEGTKNWSRYGAGETKLRLLAWKEIINSVIPVVANGIATVIY
jgi:hypothetical protein